jgi:5'-3' exoribonuclease 2
LKILYTDKKGSSRTEDEIIKSSMHYIGKIFRIIRLRRLLYMAIDDVASRAKMHHRRSIRFLDARKNPLQDGYFNKSSIKPRTEFMSKLSDCLRYYICICMNTEPNWKSIKVILSDANSPREVEHKIMNYIRESAK